MGLTYVSVLVANPTRPARRLHVRMLLDSGAMYSVVDSGTLGKLGIRPTSTRAFVLADGTEVTRRTGAAFFHFRGEDGPSIVAFGEPGDATLLGVLTLEGLGLVLDPVRRELRPMRLPL